MLNPVPLFVNYKDTKYLSQFLTPHSRMMSRRRTNMPAGHQRKLETAIKHARYMALLPYVSN